MLTEFVKDFNERLTEGLASGFLKEEYFTTTNYLNGSEAHSRTLAIAARACFELGYDVEIERRIGYEQEGKKHSFIPDIVTYKAGERITFIEYESTNSSDDRYYNSEEYTKSGKKNILGLCGDANSESTPPKFWVNIFTLPDMEVKSRDWESWAYKKTNPEYQKLIASPYKHFIPKYVEETKKIQQIVGAQTQIVVMNIDQNKLSQIFPSP